MVSSLTRYAISMQPEVTVDSFSVLICPRMHQARLRTCTLRALHPVLRLDLRPEVRRTLLVQWSLVSRLEQQRADCAPGESPETRADGVVQLIRARFLQRYRWRNAYSIAPSFYSMVAAVTDATTELFADVFNCTGALSQFCSLDEEDRKFGSCGA